MDGKIKILGANQALDKFKDFEGKGSLLSIDREHHRLMLGEEKLFYQIYRTIHAEDHIEYEGWCSDKDSNVGRIGMKFIPKNA